MSGPTERGPAANRGGEIGGAELAALARCLVLGDSAVGPTSPNPPVGAVILDRSGAAIGEGATQPYGGAHAEVVALTRAGPAVVGATMVSSLEPCVHHGQTGPCVDAIASAGITRVVYGAADPNPVAGGGEAVLRARGIDVVGGHLLDEIRRSALGRWLTAIELGRPHVTWKFAATLDGRVAAADGSSRWITSPQARADVHRLRAEVDAVLVGSGTVLTDDPHLTVRNEAGELAARQPVRVVLDRRGRVRPGARIRDDSGPTFVWEDAPSELMSAMYEGGVRSVLLEGGPTLAAAFLRAGYVDRIVGYLAPALLGAGPSLVGDLGITGITQARRLVVDEVTRVGTDVRVTAAVLSPAVTATAATEE